MKRYAIFVGADKNYLPRLVMLLNSLAELGYNWDLHIISPDIPPSSQETLLSAFSFSLMRWHELRTAGRSARLVKFERYRVMAEYSGNYDACVLLDADMIAVRPFWRFFEMVENTDTLLAPVEQIQRNLVRFTCDGIHLPDQRMHWMVSSAPFFFCGKRVSKQIGELYRCMIKVLPSPGDGPPYNVALWKCGLTEQIVKLPAYCWNGVNSTYFNPGTAIRETDAGWYADTGEEVYIIHGRWDVPGFRNWYDRELERMARLAGLSEKGLEIRRKRMDGLIRSFSALARKYRHGPPVWIG